MLEDISAKKIEKFRPRCGGGGEGVPKSAKIVIFQHFRLIFMQNLYTPKKSYSESAP